MMRPRPNPTGGGVRPAASTLYLFTSERDPTLHAFCGESAGEALPERHGPWTAAGEAKAGAALPHGLSRAAASDIILRQGFALWRVKTTKPTT